MNNYIVINNQKIELTEEQVRQIVEAQSQGNSTVQLADMEAGDTFKLGEYEFIILENSGDTTAVILKDLLPDMVFGSTNNYDGSGVDEACREFAQKLSEVIGWENIVPHEVDLTSNDGLKDYGVIERRASLLTADRYRRYVGILDQFKPDDWWWLSTPYSTERHENALWILCVAPSGCFGSGHYDIGCGVRPFCILKSTIFVSK